MIDIHQTDLDGLLLITADAYFDNRGFFLETFRQEQFPQSFVQHNHSRSERGVLRGLHFQRERPQGKLVRVVRGAIFDVAVDIRQGSPTYGHWEGFLLSDENHRQVYVPPGFAHGFLTLSSLADVEYKCTEYYHRESEAGIRWNDPNLAIRWPLAGLNPLVSQKDQELPFLSEIQG